LPPRTVKKRWSDQAGRNVVEFAEYAISPGPHRLRVTVAECDSVDADVVVEPVKGAVLKGTLRSTHSILLRGPQGTPGLLRGGLALWLASGQAQASSPESYQSNGLSTTGLTVDLGLVWRWYGLFLDGSYGSGSFARRSFDTHYALPSSASVTWDRAVLRTGPRFPFNLVSLGFGPLLGLEEIDLSGVRTGVPSGILGGYVELDVQPLCDWGVFVIGTFEKPFGKDQPSGGLHIGAFWEPNPRCRTERATQIGLAQTN
jgi:hypothetical protein